MALQSQRNSVALQSQWNSVVLQSHWNSVALQSHWNSVALQSQRCSLIGTVWPCSLIGTVWPCSLRGTVSPCSFGGTVGPCSFIGTVRILQSLGRAGVSLFTTLLKLFQFGVFRHKQVRFCLSSCFTSLYDEYSLLFFSSLPQATDTGLCSCCFYYRQLMIRFIRLSFPFTTGN